MEHEMQWQTVYEEHVRDVRRFLMYVLKNPSEVDDLVHETFVRTFRNWDRVGESHTAKTWILTVARNLAVDQMRRRKRTQLLQGLLQRQPVAPLPVPEDVLRLDERKRKLYDAISELKESYRLVVILRGIQELSSAETAEVLGWNANKVNVTYHRALKALRSLLEGEDVHERFE